MGVKCTRSRVWQTFEELVFTASYLWTLTYYLPPSKPRLFFWKMGVILSYLVTIFWGINKIMEANHLIIAHRDFKKWEPFLMITISSDMAAIHLFQNYFSWQMDHETLSQVERASGTKSLISNSLWPFGKWQGDECRGKWSRQKSGCTCWVGVRW